MVMDIGGGQGDDNDEVIMDINTTPLIDVMLVLIIMLIITIPVSLHAVRLDTPRAAAAPTPPPPPAEVTLAITADGTWTWNGEPVPDRAALASRLAELARTPDTPLRLQPAADAPYEAVAAVLSSAQRLGVSRLGLGDLGPYSR